MIVKLKSLMLKDRIGAQAGATIQNLVVGMQGVKSLEYDSNMPDVVLGQLRIQGNPGDSAVLFPLSFAKFGVIDKASLAEADPDAAKQLEAIETAPAPEPMVVVLPPEPEAIPVVEKQAAEMYRDAAPVVEQPRRKPGRPRKS